MPKKIVLENGLRVFLVPQKEALTATALVLVEAGSKYETKEINGLSHFLEHMCFKGTEKRPKAIDIVGELDALGAQYNAFTDSEFTGYYAKSTANNVHKILEIIADLYLNPVFKEEEIDKERGVIIQEINMYEDLPQRKVQSVFTSLLYGDQPAGWDIAGDKENIKKLQRVDFIKYRHSHYVASSTIVVVVGGFAEEKVLKDIERYFYTLPTDKKQGKLAVIENQTEPKVKIQNKQSDQTHLVLGVRAVSGRDIRRFPLAVLSDILGGGMSSRLFQKIREELAAAYYVRAQTDLSTDHGFLAVSAGVEHKKLEEVIEAIVGEMEKIKKEGVTIAEIKKSKEHLIGNLTLGLETTDELATFIGEQEIIRGQVIEAEEVIKKIREVKKEEIDNLAREMFINKNLNLALIGPHLDKERRFVNKLTVVLT